MPSPWYTGGVSPTARLAAIAMGLPVGRARTGEQMGPGAPCPGNPPPPSQLKVMQGIARPELQAWALSIVNDPLASYGQIFERSFGDKLITARVEHHPWTTHGAEVIHGCYKGVTLYEQKLPDAAAAGEEDELPPTEDTRFFPLGAGQWCGFPSGEILDTEDLPFEPMDPSIAIASGYGTGQFVDIPGAPSPYEPYGEPPVTRDEAFAAAQQLASMYPNIRTLVAQAPDGFYVRVITLGGLGGGGLGGGLKNLFGDKGLRRQPAGRGGSDWGDVFRAMDRIPSQIGRVRVQIDRLVSGDFAVSGDPSGDAVPADEARAAQDTLRAVLLSRCSGARRWSRGVGLSYKQALCLGHSEPDHYIELLVDGSAMGEDEHAMVPSRVGRVPVNILDIGDGPVPPSMEIVAP